MDFLLCDCGTCELISLSFMASCHTAPPFTLVVRDSLERKPEKPSIWSMYRPLDISLYDLLYEDELYPNKRASGLNEAKLAAVALCTNQPLSLLILDYLDIDDYYYSHPLVKWSSFFTDQAIPSGPIFCTQHYFSVYQKKMKCFLLFNFIVQLLFIVRYCSFLLFSHVFPFLLIAS